MRCGLGEDQGQPAARRFRHQDGRPAEGRYLMPVTLKRRVYSTVVRVRRCLRGGLGEDHGQPEARRYRHQDCRPPEGRYHTPVTMKRRVYSTGTYSSCMRCGLGEDHGQPEARRFRHQDGRPTEGPPIIFEEESVQYRYVDV